MTVRAQLRRAFVLIMAISGVASAQPANDPSPILEPQPPAIDPETKVKLDAQQKLIDGLVAQQAELAKALDESRRAQDSFGTRIESERTDRLAAEAKLSSVSALRLAWPTVTVSGFLQVDAAVRQSSQDQLRQSGDPLNQDRFLLRRARPRLAASYGSVSGTIEIDINTVNGGQVRPSVVEAAYSPAPWLRAGVGIAKIPFGFEVEQSDRERLFLERSNAERALFPGEYDLGVRLSGAWRFLRYAVAAQNGEPIGEKGYTLRDPNRAKDVAARGGIETRSGDLTVAAGFSFLTGRGAHAGTPATKDVLVWRDLNEDGVVNAGEIQVIAGQAATPSQNFDRFAIGADAEIAFDLHAAGRLMLYGEIVAAGNLDRGIVVADPIASGRDARELGWYIAAVHEPTPWSSIGIRFDRYDPDADSSELRTGTIVPLDQSMTTASITGALRKDHGRLILQLDHNQNHQGRSMAGVPTNLGDDAVTLRAEVQL